MIISLYDLHLNSKKNFLDSYDSKSNFHQSFNFIGLSYYSAIYLVFLDNEKWSICISDVKLYYWQLSCSMYYNAFINIISFWVSFRKILKIFNRGSCGMAKATQQIKADMIPISSNGHDWIFWDTTETDERLRKMANIVIISCNKRLHTISLNVILNTNFRKITPCNSIP